MSKNPLTLPCVILSAACALSLMCAITLTVRRAEITFAEPANTAPAAAAETEPTLDAPDTRQELLTAFRVFPEPRETEKIYIYDNGIDIFEYPLVEGVPLSDWDMDRLFSDSKKRRKLYAENGTLRTRFGIDVSSYQGAIDWEKVAADGVEFAFIRAAYRGYETGRIVEDSRFRRNYEAAEAAGIELGVYFFSQAITEEEGIEEAEFLLSLLEECGFEPTLPIVFDWEFPTDEDPARTDDLTGEEQTACARAFCDRIREAGYETAYYATINTALFRYDMAELADIPLWLAEYSEKTNFPYAYQIWQYSSYGVVDGIEAFTDLNIMTY